MSSHWRVEGLTSRVEGFRLGPVDLELGPGRAIAVLGASGAGKTTLLRTLAGFIPPDGGRILRDGVDVTRWLPEERALGYVPQGLGLLPHRTVEGNVRFPMEIRGRADAGDRTRVLLGRFGLLPLARRRPARLSAGEQQRVALARTLAAEPKLIVWDEPWQGLDVLARHELGMVLAELREEERVPVLVVTHDPALAFSLADSFLVLSGGRVRSRGDASTLLRAPGDPFAARFVGFENVFDRRALEGGAPCSLRAWLLERAGPDGVALRNPTWSAGPAGPEAPWTGTVRSARPSPSGSRVEVRTDGLTVLLTGAVNDGSPLPAFGSTVRFGIEPASVHALGVEGFAPGAG
jgi:spermidine/putrescine transport system ATP-binding protein